jgi:hypothetical protein
VGGDKIEYPGDKSTSTAGLTTAKMIFNSTISTPGARFLVIDIKNFYLNTPLGRYEYMVVLMSSLTDVIADHKQASLQTNCYTFSLLNTWVRNMQST